MADLPPNIWMTPNITLEAPARVISSVTFASAMATISTSGEVRIDWGRVEQVANGPDFPFADVVSKATARAFLAIRDATWKPIEKTEP